MITTTPTSGPGNSTSGISQGDRCAPYNDQLSAVRENRYAAGTCAMGQRARKSLLFMERARATKTGDVQTMRLSGQSGYNTNFINSRKQRSTPAV